MCRNLAVLAIVALVAQAALSQEHSPSLQETLDWLKPKIQQLVTRFDQTRDGDMTFTDETRVIAAEDCELRLLIVNSGQARLHGRRIASSLIRTVYAIPLGSLNPAEINVIPLVPQPGYIRVGEQTFMLTAFTRDHKPIIPSKAVMNLDGKESSPSPLLVESFSVVFPDQNTANRVSNALKHAAQLCGAKIEPF